MLFRNYYVAHAFVVCNDYYSVCACACAFACVSVRVRARVRVCVRVCVCLNYTIIIFGT